MDGGAWWAATHGVVKSWTWLSDFSFTFHFHELEKEMATHSSVLAWRIPGTGEPGGLPSMGSHRVGHDWTNLAAAAAVLCYATSVASDSLWPFRLYPTTLLYPWDFSRQENWYGLPCSFPGDLPDPGIEPMSHTFPALASRFFATNATWEAPLSQSRGKKETD